MKPVFVSDSLGCLYQTGYRQLEAMAVGRRAFLASDLSLTLAVSPYVLVGWPGPNIHLPFGDNKQWVEPDDELRGMIRACANLLAEGNHVMVYCYYGRNRSGLICALIIRELLGVTGAEALRLLRRGRKGAVGGNKHFVSYLEELPAP